MIKELLKHWHEYENWCKQRVASTFDDGILKKEYYEMLPTLHGFMEYLENNQ